MSKLALTDESIRPIAPVNANRRQRRTLAKTKRGCGICGRAIVNGDDVVWGDGLSMHRTCVDAHNGHTENLRRAELDQRAQKMGLQIVRTGDLLTRIGR